MAAEVGILAGLNVARGAALDGGVPVIKAPAFEATGGGQAQFGEALWQALRSVDEQGRSASERMAAVDAGQSDDLVGAMLASQEASLSFSMLVQVRNKVVGAVDELIKLQL